MVNLSSAVATCSRLRTAGEGLIAESDPGQPSRGVWRESGAAAKRDVRRRSVERRGGNHSARASSTLVSRPPSTGSRSVTRSITVFTQAIWSRIAPAPPRLGVLADTFVADPAVAATQRATGRHGPGQVIALGHHDQLGDVEDPLGPGTRVVGVEAGVVGDHLVGRYAGVDQIARASRPARCTPAPCCRRTPRSPAPCPGRRAGAPHRAGRPGRRRESRRERPGRPAPARPAPAGTSVSA